MGQLLAEVDLQLVDDARVLGPGDHGDVLDVLHDRLELEAEVLVEVVDEGAEVCSEDGISLVCPALAWGSQGTVGAGRRIRTVNTNRTSPRTPDARPLSSMSTWFLGRPGHLYAARFPQRRRRTIDELTR